MCSTTRSGLLVIKAIPRFKLCDMLGIIVISTPDGHQRLKALTPVVIPHMKKGWKLQIGKTKGCDFVE